MNTDPKRSMRTFRQMAFAIGCVAVLGIASSAGLFVYRPVIVDLQKLDQEIAATQEFLSSEASLRTHSQQLQKHLGEMDRRFEEAITRIPETVRETEFLGQLSDLAGSSGLQMLDFRPVGVVERSGYQELTINISDKANYISLCTFLHGLRNLDRLCQVTSLNVSENAGSSEAYPASLTVAVFFAPLSSDAETGDDHAGS
jgi:Tfp pilus assembly protein PilO